MTSCSICSPGRPVSSSLTGTGGAARADVAGVVVDGPVRDIDEARACDFPVYCRALTARTARGRVAEVECNGPVTIGEVAVQPGDYVVADASGVAWSIGCVNA